jgi:hypothetical protein
LEFLDGGNRLATVSSYFGPMGVADANFKIAYFRQQGFKDIDVRDYEGATPLFRACQFGHYEAAVTLLHYGANPKATTKSGATPRSILVQPARLPRLEVPELGNKQQIDAFFSQYDQMVGHQRKRILALLNQKQLARKNLTQKGISQKGISQKGISQKGISQKGISQKGISQKKTAKPGAKRSLFKH